MNFHRFYALIVEDCGRPTGRQRPRTDAIGNSHEAASVRAVSRRVLGAYGMAQRFSLILRGHKALSADLM